MIRHKFLVFLLSGVSLAACSSSSSHKIAGSVQKGPFVLGSNVDVAVLDTQGDPTGQRYGTETIDDLGNFSVSLPAASTVRLTAQGFYFNEVVGRLSRANITLHAVANIVEAGTQDTYINVFTHMMEPRARTLIKNGVPFEQAISQAESELRRSLSFKGGTNSSQHGTDMNLLGGDDLGNAYLLATSCVLAQASRIADPSAVEANLQALVNNIGRDLADDGVMHRSIADQLREAERRLNPGQCRRNLASFIESKELAIETPNLDRIIDTDGDETPNDSDDDDDNDGVADADDCDPYDDTIGAPPFGQQCPDPGNPPTPCYLTDGGCPMDARPPSVSRDAAPRSDVYYPVVRQDGASYPDGLRPSQPRDASYPRFD